jgi:DNA-binding MarR family transcriptional regulator
MKSDEAHSLSQCSECACFNVRKAARAITRFYDAVLQPSGILATQFTLLAVAQSKGELPITETADRLGLDRTTLTRNLKVLETRGLIAVGPGKDGRTKSITVTVAGRDALMKALPYWKKAQQLVVRDLGHSRFKTLLKELAAIRAVSKQSIS